MASMAVSTDEYAVMIDTRDPLERRLVNVVEEMSIASGVRVPAVYVMDGEVGINAFAAGYEVSDSIVAVTRGTLELDNTSAVVADRILGETAGLVETGAPQPLVHAA